MNSFASLGLSPEIVKAVESQGYETPTPIQAAAIPKVLAGHDLLAAAQTGTGKTAAFMLPILERLKKFSSTSVSPAMHPVRVLVLTPTRELADQIALNVKAYTQFLPLRHAVIFGGMNMDAQVQILRSGVEIVVATPGRLLDHIGQKTIQLNKVEMVVLDEADRMLDMGFIQDIRKIMLMLPVNRQILLFSATFAPEIKKLAEDFMRSPEVIEVARQNATSELVEQHIIAVDTPRKRQLLERLIVDLNMTQVIVFCKTKQSVDQVARELKRKNISAEPIHGDKTQTLRTDTLESFKSGELRVLVATDVAARGLDVTELPFVINYEMPNSPEDYVHRIGRTGRAGADGVAISLMDEHEQKMFESIAKLIKQPLKIEKIEGFEPRWMIPATDERISGAFEKVEKPTNHARRSPPSNNQNSLATQNSSGNQNTAPARRNNMGSASRAVSDGLSTNAKNDVNGGVCARIPGREKRSRRSRPVPALFLP